MRVLLSATDDREQAYILLLESATAQGCMHLICGLPGFQGVDVAITELDDTAAPVLLTPAGSAPNSTDDLKPTKSTTPPKMFWHLYSRSACRYVPYAGVQSMPGPPPHWSAVQHPQALINSLPAEDITSCMRHAQRRCTHRFLWPIPGRIGVVWRQCLAACHKDDLLLERCVRPACKNT